MKNGIQTIAFVGLNKQLKPAKYNQVSFELKFIPMIVKVDSIEFEKVLTFLKKLF